MSLLIERSGALACLQDSGRFGVRHLGVTQGGSADWCSHYWANWLLSNPLAAPVIEIVLGNFELLAQSDSCFALTGADLGASLDDQPLLPWRSFHIRQGQRLRFHQPRQGARAYLAAPGGFHSQQIMNSCATVCREGLGGLRGDGHPLAAGDVLHWQGLPPTPRDIAISQIPSLGYNAQLSVVLGAQIGDFRGQSLFDTFNCEWLVDQRADRMGIRLTGPTLQCTRQSMVSEGVPLGAIQVPSDGQPIVLLNDRQTIGGYPRLGALTPLSVARLAQCLPGSSIRLKPIALIDAQQQHHQLLASWHIASVHW